jgi:hypothetical protein
MLILIVLNGSGEDIEAVSLRRPGAGRRFEVQFDFLQGPLITYVVLDSPNVPGGGMGSTFFPGPHNWCCSLVEPIEGSEFLGKAACGIPPSASRFPGKEIENIRM